MLWPQVLSAMTVMLCMLVDSIMIGQFLGVDAMSAYGLTTPVLLVFAALGSMISAGVQVVCGKAVGTVDRKATDACFSASVVLAAVISGLGLGLVLVFAEPLCTLLGAGAAGTSEPVFGMTKQYLIGFILGAPAFISAQIMIPYLQMSGSRTRLVVAVAAMTVSDIVFDCLNVLLFHGGTFGMGLASSLSYYVAFVIGLGTFLKKDRLFHLRFQNGVAKTCLSILRHGIPTVVNQISMVLLTFLLNKILIQVGQYRAVAPYSVISTIGNISFSFGTGIGAVALMLSSVFFADEDRNALKELVKTMAAYGAVLDFLVTVLVMTFAGFLVRLFVPEDPAAERMATEGVRLFALCLVPSALNSAFKNYYQGIGRSKLTQVISVLQNFALAALYALILSRFFGTTGVWLAFVFGEATTFVLLTLLVWKRYGRVSISAEAYAMLPKGFGAAEEDCLECTILSMSDVAAAASRTESFCRCRGQSPTAAKQVAVCVQEMTSNIVQYGFTSDTKPHSIFVRVVHRGNEQVIRIRDNCVEFDPVHYFELHRADESHAGIRSVMAIVKDASYIHSLGLNILTLHL